MRLLFVSLVLLVASCHAHICMIYPPQRGGYNISTPGNSACYEPQAPCGTQPVGSPVLKLRGGTIFYLLVQQNLNHYNPGHPGFIDVAWDVGTNQTSDSQFTDLNAISDYWPHFQGTQTNFSIPIYVPDVFCEHCTLRVRYHPNKPTEPVFHQCADVSIVPSDDTPASPDGSMLALMKTSSPVVRPRFPGEKGQDSELVNIDLTNGLVSFIGEQFGERESSPSNVIQSYGLITAVDADEAFAVIGQPRSTGVDNLAANKFFKYSLSGELQTEQEIPRPTNVDQWVSILSTGSSSETVHGKFALVGQIPNTDGSYSYAVYMYSEGNNTLSEPIATTPTGEETYVNIFWADFSECNNMVYLLAGDENSLTTLDAMLWSFDIEAGSVSGVMVDNSLYTVSTIHSTTANCGILYSLSPGLVEEDPSERYWSLIQIDPTSGSIVNALSVTSPGEYALNYSGGVYGDSINMNGILFHLFYRSIDGVVDLLAVDIGTGTIKWQVSPNLGVNTAYSLVNALFINSKEIID